MDKSQQVSLFQEQIGVLEIKKHSSLVQMNNVTSMQQRKAMNSLIRVAKDQLKRDPDKKVFTIELGLLKRLARISRNDNTELKQSLKALVSLVIEYNILGKDKYERGAFPFLSFVRITGQKRGNTAVVNFELPSPILDAVKRPNMYVKLNLFIWRDLSSKHSLALYEVLKDYQKIKKIRIDIDDFRKIVGLEPGQYKIFTMLRKRVIDVAVDEINEKTDLKVGYDLEKQGRKIVAISFEVSGTPLYEEQDRNNIEILTKLEEYGIRKKQALELIEMHDEDYILANIRVVEDEIQNGKEIRNVAAYLMKAFEVDFRPAETQYDKAKKAQRLQAEQEQVAEDSRKQEEKKLLQAFNKKKNVALEKLLKTLDQNDLESLKEEFLSGVKDNSLFSKMLESKGFDSSIIQMQRKKFLAEKHLPREVYDFDFYLHHLENGAMEYVSEKGLKKNVVSYDASLKSF